jgi:hypothetical protein
MSSQIIGRQSDSLVVKVDTPYDAAKAQEFAKKYDLQYEYFEDKGIFSTRHYVTLTNVSHSIPATVAIKVLSRWETVEVF